ncbi:PHP domain-containing protein [Cupriavidus sp. UYPR2.512]|uniref:PHP domain-containing protein n=1 Tax=Cupriavidus sp. UYPR2.512 TaxID=1080187 RepID=UPI000377BCB6|nr:PHP domain-containing protein [Cupriavidus sp. UYPR2.512]UIF88359.1 PHP domain-containing protein [Cupriavidus necator]
MPAINGAGLPAYAELHCLSNFTLLAGASRPEELAERAAQLGYQALAITDECSLAGIVRAHIEAKKAGVRLVVGASFRLQNADGSPALSFVALARNREGYGNLCELITLARMRAAKGSYVLTPRDLPMPEAPHQHLKGLPDCLVVFTPDYTTPAEKLDAQAAWVSATFAGRAWMGLSLLYRPMDDIHRGTVEAAAATHHLRIVATGYINLHVRSRKPLHDVLTAVRVGRPVSACGYHLAPNAEQHLRSRLRLANIYPHRYLTESVHIANLCQFSLDELRYEYPDELVPEGVTPAEYLRAETFVGAHRRFPQGIPLPVQQQIEHELALIREMSYEFYFLTVYDIVTFARVFAEGIFRQIQGFGEYGFPESHAASFALLVYASAWLKCHEPQAFLCAMLNSQPMGFYTPSQLIQDAKRHGVEVLPADVAISGWDSSLESSLGGARPGVRLGLSLLRGMRNEAAQRIEEARAIRPFASVRDLATRAGLDRHDIQVLAGANALHSLTGGRRQALWQAAAAVPDKDLLRPADLPEDATVLAMPTEGEEIVSDYRAMGLTLRRHPLALLRPMLAVRRFVPASALATYRTRQAARGAGIVTVRQRPGTSNGVVFMTLEDETGVINVIIWPTVLERFRKEILSASLVGVYGQWQCEGEVRHLIAQRVVDLSWMLGQLDTRSRNFC